MSKPWYKSRTKIGAVMVSAGTIVATAGLIVKEELALDVGIPIIIAEAGVLLTIFGYRNAMEKKT